MRSWCIVLGSPGRFSFSYPDRTVRRQATFLSPCANGQIIFCPYYPPGIESRSPALWGIPYHLSHKGSPRILSLLQGIFPTQELNWGPLHCRWIIYQLNYQALVLIYICIKNGTLLGFRLCEWSQFQLRPWKDRRPYLLTSMHAC